MPAALHLRRALALVAAALVAATMFLVSTGTPAEAAKNTRHERILRAAKIAKRQLGDPYQWGATGPHRFDCSGLTQFAYKRAGVGLPRTSDAQANRTRRIPRKAMKRGDLMFFHSGGDVYHVGMFVGWRNGRRLMVHASRPGTPVKRDAPWTNSWYAGTMRGSR